MSKFLRVCVQSLCCALIGFAVSTGAFAACTGGTAVKGSFGVLINGPSDFAGAEIFTGLLKFDGACGVTGSLIGSMGNTYPTGTYSVTGTYSAPPNGFGTLILSVPNLFSEGVPASLYFSYSVVAKGTEVIGVEDDSAGLAPMDLVRQSEAGFSNASISGVFSHACALTPSELDSDTYNGSGGGTFTVANNYSNGNFTYQVQKNGLFTADNNQKNYASFGVIVHQGTEHFVMISAPNNFGGSSASDICIEKK
jgi:hypothetical protein